MLILLLYILQISTIANLWSLSKLPKIIEQVSGRTKPRFLIFQSFSQGQTNAILMKGLHA